MKDFLRENTCRSVPETRGFICDTNGFTASQGGKIHGIRQWTTSGGAGS